jgi:parallel beta-helix repeat protein/predicted outer membrane repeat protein
MRDQSFYLDKDIEIYGGFAGTETLLSQRNSASNAVLLSGDIDASGNNDCYHVFITEGLSSAAVLDGVTITGGKADGSSTINYSGQTYFQSSGGGMRNHGSSPTLTDVTISGNTAASFGGGIYNRTSSSPTLTNVTISGNTASTDGGGIYNYSSSSPILTNVTIRDNTVGSSGGGIYNSSSSLTLTNVTISGNTATNGGGMRNILSSSTIVNTLFWGNIKGTSSTIAGADIDNSSSSTATISYSLVQLASTSYTSGNNNLLTTNTNMVYATDPSFVNASDPDGADNVWMTGDDGLVLSSTSPGIGAGTSSSARLYDITNKLIQKNSSTITCDNA